MSREHELHFLRQQLECCYLLEWQDVRQEAQTNVFSLWVRRMQAMWRGFSTFMIHQPSLQTSQDVSKSDYAQKVRLYPYLSPIEEERDWLEKNYRNPDDR